MKLLVYAIDFLPLVGGEETFLRILLGGIARQEGIEVTLVTRTPRGSFDDGRLPYPVVRRPGPLALWRMVGRADVVHVSGPVLIVLLLGWIRGRPVVVTHHLYHAACPNGLLVKQTGGRVCRGEFRARRYGECLRCNAVSRGWVESARMLLATFLRRWLSGRVTANVAITDHVLRRVGLPRTRTIQYGIPEPGFVTGASGQGGPDPEFAFVGRLVQEKGVRILLQAIALLARDARRVRLVVVGDGPERAALEREADDPAIAGRIRFTGFLEGDQLERALAEVAALVMPSTWEETAGLAAIEHMKRGGVVVASDLGGLAEIVGPAGLRVAPGDATALAAALRGILDDPTRAAELGRAARTRSRERFDEGRMVREYVALYRDVSARREPQGRR